MLMSTRVACLSTSSSSDETSQLLSPTCTNGRLDCSINHELPRTSLSAHREIEKESHEEKQELLHMSKPHRWGNWMVSNLPVSPLYTPSWVHWGLTLIGALDMLEQMKTALNLPEILKKEATIALPRHDRETPTNFFWPSSWCSLFCFTPLASVCCH